VRFARIYRWPGSIPKGNGTWLLVMDEWTAPKHRRALVTLESREQGHPYFEIVAAVCPNVVEPVVAPIEIQVNRERRQATGRTIRVIGGQFTPGATVPIALLNTYTWHVVTIGTARSEAAR
jgi:hypothetical protein